MTGDARAASSPTEITNRSMLRAKDTIDRCWSEPLDIRALASMSAMSPAHFIRTFRGTFGETPHRYLQRRRIERAMFLLRTTDAAIIDISLHVGFNSLGTFGRTFRNVVGETPTAHRARGPLPAVPNCFVMTWTRPSSFGEASPRRDL